MPPDETSTRPATFDERFAAVELELPGDAPPAQFEKMQQNAERERLLADLYADDPDGLPTDEPDNNPTYLESAFGTMYSFSKDVGVGLAESPAQVVGGVSDAISSVGNLMETVLPAGGIQITDPETGEFDFKMLGSEEFKERQAAGETIGAALTPEEARSTTGGIIRTMAQFLAPFGAVSKGLKAAGLTSAIPRAAGAGAITDFSAFEGSDQTLAELIQSVPELENPITEFLASGDDDTEIEGRLKNAIEGLALGAAVDTLAPVFMKGLRAYRDMRRARGTQAPEVAAELGEITEPKNAFEILGDVDSDDLVRVQRIGDKPMTGFAAERMARVVDDVETGVPVDVEVRGLKEGAADVSQVAQEDKLFVNWARIDAPDDVKRIMEEMVDALKQPIEEARGGKVKTFQQTRLNAEQVDAFEMLTSRRPGWLPDEDATLAARELWVSSANKLSEVIDVVAKNPTPENVFAYRKQMETHAFIGQEVSGIRTGQARALGQWRIVAGEGSTARARQVDALVQEFGGLEVNQSLAKRMQVLLRQPGGASKLEKKMQPSLYSKTIGSVQEYWGNALLSGPHTHLVNILSNTSVIALRVAERGVSAQLSKILREVPDTGVEVGEATAMFSGALDSFNDGLRYAWHTLKTGETEQFVSFDSAKTQHRANIGGITKEQELGTATGVGGGSRRQISSSNYGWRDDSWYGKTADYFGAAVNSSYRMLAAEDEFFKTIGYRMELNALAVRQARQEVVRGDIPETAFKDRVTEIVDNPPEQVKIDAVDSAAYNTFTNRAGRFTQAVRRVTAEHPVLRFLFPFTNTPANIMTFTFERTPLAPFMTRWKDNIAAGGARRDAAIAQMGMGSMLIASSFDLAMKGIVTGGGPNRPEERQYLSRNGWQKYSFYADGRFFAFSRVDPLGLQMGLAGDLFEIMANTYGDDDTPVELDELFAMTAASVAQNLTDKTYFQSASDFITMLSDERRYAPTFLQRFAGSFVPAGVATIERMVDPASRHVTNVVDAVKARIPGLSADVPVRRDLWGREASFSSGLGPGYDMISPIYSREFKPEPIDLVMGDNGFYVGMPTNKLSFNGVYYNARNRPDIYNRYVELAGNEPVHPAYGMGAKDLLNSIVTGGHRLSPLFNSLSDGDEGGKERFIRDIVSEYRQFARQRILQEFPEVADHVDLRQAERMRLMRVAQ